MSNREKSIVVRLFLVVLLLVAPATVWGRRSEEWSRHERYLIKQICGEVKPVAGMNQIETENWIVRTAHNDRFTAEAAYFIELFTETFLDSFFVEGTFRVPGKPLFIIHASAEAYAGEPDIIPGSGGMFRYWVRESEENTEWNLVLFAFIESTDLSAPDLRHSNLEVIQHEAAHALLRRLFGRRYIPIWLNEGVASYYQHMDIFTSSRLRGKSTAISDEAARAERNERSPCPRFLAKFADRYEGYVPSLAYLLNLVTMTDWSPDEMGELTRCHYAMAEGLVDFLLSSRGGRNLLERMMTAIDEGRGPLLSAGELRQLNQHWREFVKTQWGVRLADD